MTRSALATPFGFPWVTHEWNRLIAEFKPFASEIASRIHDDGINIPRHATGSIA
ncbi:MAG TPA: hypothetical protein PK765_04685 [bacterium]|nr:hypothetical protein [bacterium]